MTSWRVVIATPYLPFLPYENEQERQLQRLVETALAHDAAVTLVAPYTPAARRRASYLLTRSKFLLRPVIPNDDPRHREVITTWIEPPAPGPSRFLLEHPWFSELDQGNVPLAPASINLSTAWALWTSAFFSLLSQLNYKITIIHALGWQMGLVSPMSRCIAGSPMQAATVFSPGAALPPDPLKPQVRALLRLPQEMPAAGTEESLLAWGLIYASAWEITPYDYQYLARDTGLATLLEQYHRECLLPQKRDDPLPEMLEHKAIARYARVLADARSLMQEVP